MKKALGILIIVVILAGVGLVLFAPFFERKPPQIQLLSPKGYINAKSTIKLSLTDRPTGLKEARVILQQGKRSWHLYTGTFRVGTYSVRIPLMVEPAKLGLKEGPAVLLVRATDRSFWNLGRGNTAEAKFRLTVDYTPPLVELLDNTRYIYEQGAGAAVFETSEDAVSAGVQVGKLFFKAYPQKSHKRTLWAVLFGIPLYAHSHKARLVVRDRAGNTRIVSIPFHVIPRKVVKETITISDDFIEKKVYPLLPPGDRDLPPIQAFKKVNTEVRQQSNERLSRLAAQSSGSCLWKGPFIQLKGSKVTATFGDERTYLYKGKVIGHSVHLGYDLASVAHAPVPAANRGRVLFTGFVGVYGNVVLIDHGLGLVTLYAHLSSATVSQGQQVEKGQIIGYTDSTGLAGGDHLHYGVFLSGHPVNPMEWWDKRWLRDRILAVLKPYIR